MFTAPSLDIRAHDYFMDGGRTERKSQLVAASSNRQKRMPV